MHKGESLFKHQRDGAKLYHQLVKTVNEKHKIDIATL